MTQTTDNEHSGATACYVDATSDDQRAEGGIRVVRTFDDRHWISVSYRRTGFGWMEWETALCIVADVPNPTWKDRDCLIIAGDRRNELADIDPADWREWYAARIDGNRNSMEAILNAASEST
jgi:hypothetical protein|tara:strand:+ start:63 stop:428 length:366 start_codon:yes stop_codon:yes gene_type:complete